MTCASSFVSPASTILSVTSVVFVVVGLSFDASGAIIIGTGRELCRTIFLLERKVPLRNL